MVNVILYLSIRGIRSEVQLEHSTWLVPVLYWLLSVLPLTSGRR